MGAVRTTLTMEEFLQLPELPAGKRELLRGELIDLPPAKRKHTQTAHRIYERLKTALTTTGISGEVYLEMGYKIGPRHWFQPDVSITHPNQGGDDYFDGSPLLAVEIVSPSNTARQIELKIQDYLTFGAAEVWVLYPDSRGMWVYAPDRSAQYHKGAFLAQVLDGQRIDLDEILGDSRE